MTVPGSAPDSWAPSRPGGPPAPSSRVRHRPYRAAYVVGVVGALAIVLALVVPVAAGFWAQRALGGTAQRSTSTRPVEADAGAGDPYFPDYGSAGYDAQSYVIAVDWDPDQARLSGRTTITAVATRDVPSVFVDLVLDVTAVTLDGAPATFRRTGTQDVMITGPTTIGAGATFTLVIDYTGQPGNFTRAGIRPFASKGKEAVIAGEPEASAWWFPANDYPSDPATVDLSVRVPAGMEAVSIGRLASRDTAEEADHDTWHWVSDAPVATYLIFLGLGQYELQQGTADGRPYVYAVSAQLSAKVRAAAFTQLQRTPAIIADHEKRFGPYPFGEIGGFVPAVDLPFDGLEAQTRPVYLAASITDQRFATELLVHELAHLWFGDHVTVARWDDIFTNEAYASWAAWAYDEEHGGRPAAEQLQDTYRRLAGRTDFWRITMIDPGPDHLFDVVYFRGPMTLQALRNVIGDAAFAKLNRDWAQQAGSRSLEQWMVKAQSVTTTDLTPFFDAWIYAPTAPAATAANGLA